MLLQTKIKLNALGHPFSFILKCNSFVSKSFIKLKNSWPPDVVVVFNSGLKYCKDPLACRDLNTFHLARFLQYSRVDSEYTVHVHSTLL